VNLPTLTADDFLPVLPAALLVAGGIVLMLTEVFLDATSRTYQAMLAVLVSLGATVLAVQNASEPARLVLQGYAVLDPFSSYLTAMVCVGTALTVLLSAGFLKHRNAERGEYYALVLFAAAGMSLLALSAEFITLFINLEVMSIATYALTAYLRRGPRPAEAGFKYFILGAFASSLLLYGAALLYGATGSTHFVEIGAALPAAVINSKGLVYAGFGLVLAGFAFKVAAVPFHMWTPDVYEGAPTPITALMSVGVKAAAFVALVRVFTFSRWCRGIDPQVPYVLFSTLALADDGGGQPARHAPAQREAHARVLQRRARRLFAAGCGCAVRRPRRAGLARRPGGRLRCWGSRLTCRASVYKGILFYLLGYTVTAHRSLRGHRRHRAP
jgi:NADH-quinone oxidoreductase subunit N